MMIKETEAKTHLFRQLTESSYLYHHPFSYGETIPGGPKAMDSVFCLFQAKISERGVEDTLTLLPELPTFLMKGFKEKILNDDAKFLRDVGFSQDQIDIIARLPVHTDVRTDKPFQDPRFQDEVWFNEFQIEGKTRIVAASGDLALHVSAPNIEAETILLFQRDAGAPAGAFGWQIGGGLCDERLGGKAFSELGEENCAVIFNRTEQGIELCPVRFVLDEEEVPEVVITNEKYKAAAETEIRRLVNDDVQISWGEPVVYDLEKVKLPQVDQLVVQDQQGQTLETVPGRIVWQPENNTLSYQFGARLNLDLNVEDTSIAKGVVFFDQEFGRLKTLYRPGAALQGKPDAKGGFETGAILPFAAAYTDGFFGRGTSPVYGIAPPPRP